MRKLFLLLPILFCAAHAHAGRFSMGYGAASPATYVSSAPSSGNVPSSGNWGNVASVSLTPGDWDVSGAINIVANGATVTGTSGAISINSGATTTDHAAGDNQVDGLLATAALSGAITIPTYRVRVTTATTVYLKVKATYAVATPTITGRISARRAL